MHRLSAFAAVLIALGCLPAALWAQVPAKPGAPPQTTSVMAYVVAFILLGLISFAAWKSSKRTHQD
ncbi:MAG: hypothetical protein R3236_07475 [Phycisphaeraceae bacterium]|nr:hypothetical protein [Phycisphaeraceae bacterium]